MRSAVVAASLVSAVTASWGPGAPAQGPPGGSWGNGPESDSWTTEVVTAFTTYCPEATQITHGGQTYTATEATTFTITDCPGGCTISYPATSWATGATTWAETTPAVETSPVATTPAESTPWGYTTEATTEATTAPTTWATTPAPVPTTPAPAPYPVANATTWATSAIGSTASSYPTGVVPATGGAAQLSAAGAAIAAVFGLVAAL